MLLIIFKISSISFWEVSGMINSGALVLTGSSWIPFPQTSVATEGITAGVVTSSMIGILAYVFTDVEITLGAAEGPRISFGGAIFGEKILPLRVTLLVPEMLLMSELSSSELSSSEICSICLTPW